ncbi:hypothetical protein N8T08_009463 [Aspergillus melleus]|uniref:Uncharacterized protein n=1 Tax=Aspergillus melleus TaxID=138277 RepID=A0ACC3BCN5_9EURO|nr:hypothetical protein N8T08_009463 [Aspergillus melleus]
MHLQEGFNKLQWFLRVNYEALTRICRKIERSPVRDASKHQSIQLNLARLTEIRDSFVPPFTQKLDSLMKDVSQARDKARAPEMLQRPHSKSCTDLSTSSMCSSENFPIILVCLLEDRAVDLGKELEKGLENPNLLDDCALLDLLNHLAHLSIICGSRQCSLFLLFEAMPKYDVQPNHHLLSHIIAASAQGRYLTDPDNLTYSTRDENDDNSNNVGLNLFHRVMQLLGNSRLVTLSTRDTLDRIALHYAAIHGLSDTCREILASCQDSKKDSLSSMILAKDFQQYTPMHYAVINNHPAVVKTLLEGLYLIHEANELPIDQKLLFTLLSIAMGYGFGEIVELLAKCPLDHKITSLQGETALYLATRTGQERYVKTLLKNGGAVSINAPEAVHGWTPLFIACVNGYESVVRCLLQAGARQDMQDRNGWMPKEHAAFRGYLSLAGDLASLNNLSRSGGPAEIPLKPISEARSSVEDGKSRLIVNLGVLQHGKSAKAVDLRSFADRPVDRNIGLSIEISASEKQSGTYVTELPFLTDTVNKPFIFALTHPKAASITFKLYQQVPHYSASHTPIGSATALLQTQNDCFGENRESLVRERTIPIIQKETMDVIGTITFTFLIAKPMEILIPSFRARPSVKTKGLQLVGHRGLGQNTASRNYLQLGENTVESFLTAAKHGATHVEFMHASYLQSPRGNPVSVLGRPSSKEAQIKPRSRSFSRGYQRGTESIHHRMKYTVDFMNKGFKPNTRGDFIQGSFTTLDELLKELPESIGFNVEVKYPRLHEAAEAGVGPIAIEINTFVDKILESIFRSKTDTHRDIMLSSFTPEVCILLALKQRKYPVMFITNAGKPPMTDMEMRASSLQAAVRFAKHWSLAGIVFASETLVMCPRLISYVKRSGLTCGSYGPLNNVPGNVKIQAAAGIDIIMADRVGLIAKALRM